MARKVKIDNADLKKYKRERKKENKDIVAYFLIVCEGEKTEPNYFKAFPKKQGRIVYDIKFDGGGINTLKVVDTAIDLKNKSRQKYDSVWAVFDKDSFKSNSFNGAILKANKNDIKCAWSNEAFEIWYLLHFENRITSMNRTQYQKAIENAINKKILKGQPKFSYKKNDETMYQTLERYGNQNNAIKWAKKLNENIINNNFAKTNPATQVYKLVEELTGKSNELITELLEKYKKGE